MGGGRSCPGSWIEATAWGVERAGAHGYNGVMPAKRRRRRTSRLPYREVLARLEALEALCRKLKAFNNRMVAAEAEQDREIRDWVRRSEAQRIAFVNDMVERGVFGPDDPRTNRLLEARLGL